MKINFITSFWYNDKINDLKFTWTDAKFIPRKEDAIFYTFDNKIMTFFVKSIKWVDQNNIIINLEPNI